MPIMAEEEGCDMKCILFCLTMALLIGCGSSEFKTADDVAKALNEYSEYSIVDCYIPTIFQPPIAEMVGANSGIFCKLESQTGSVENYEVVEIFTFDGNAESACQSNEYKESKYSYCEAVFMDDRQASFHSNVMISVDGDSNLSEALISSLP